MRNAAKDAKKITHEKKNNTTHGSEIATKIIQKKKCNVTAKISKRENNNAKFVRLQRSVKLHEIANKF